MESMGTEENFNVIIAGSENYNNYEFLKTTCDHLLVNKRETHKIMILTGGTGKGAEALAEKYAIENNFKVVKMAIDWDRFGKRAGYLRDKKMIKLSNACVLFISQGDSEKGTEMLERMSGEEKLIVRKYYDKRTDD